MPPSAQGRSPVDVPLRAYFGLAFGITWGVGGIALLSGELRGGGAPLHPLHYVAAFGPSLAGLLMAAATGGWAGLLEILARLVPRAASIPWYAATLLGFPLVNVFVACLFFPEFRAHLPTWGRLLYLLPCTLITDTGPLGEEFGWRGFALPRMLVRQRPVYVALQLGVIWWAWHLPTFFIRTLSQHQLSIPLFLLNSVALSVIMMGLYLRTRGDLLLMICVHLAANYCGGIGVPFGVEVCVEVALALWILGKLISAGDGEKGKV